jgi:hypothetical protein
MVRTLKSGEDALAGRVSELEGVLRGWNEVFASPSRALQAAGVTRASNTPAALAARLTALATSLAQSEEARLAAATAHAQEVSDLRAALRDSGRVTREQGARELRDLAGQAETVIAGERATRAAAQEELAAFKATMAEEIRRGVAAEAGAATRALRAQLAAAQAEAAGAAAAREAAEAGAAAARAAGEAARAEAATQAQLAKEELGESAGRAAAGQRAAAAALAGARAEAAEREGALDGAWRRKWEETQAAWERSTGAVRTAALEAQIAFLTRRVRELQELAQAMQVALGGGRGGEVEGGQAPPLHGSGGSASSSSASSSSSGGGGGGGLAAQGAGGAKAASWRRMAFGSAPVIVKHGALEAAGRAWKALGNTTPAATAFLSVR